MKQPLLAVMIPHDDAICESVPSHPQVDRSMVLSVVVPEVLDTVYRTLLPETVPDTDDLTTIEVCFYELISNTEDFIEYLCDSDYDQHLDEILNLDEVTLSSMSLTVPGTTVLSLKEAYIDFAYNVMLHYFTGLKFSWDLYHTVTQDDLSFLEGQLEVTIVAHDQLYVKTKQLNLDNIRVPPSISTLANRICPTVITGDY